MVAFEQEYGIIAQMTFSLTTSQSGAGEPSFVDPDCVAGRYKVVGVLGRGGMASVYRVKDNRTGQVSALKRLCGPNGEAPNDLAQQLFEREFHTLNQMQHPRIVRAYDYGLDGDFPFYTMEILDGGDLKELAPMGQAEVCKMAYEVCSALSLLHSRRLVHRDLTPRNVRRTADGKAKLIDFGLMSPMEPNQPVAGTPPYVAPELLNGLTLDARSDLFSLGATMYFALTGKHAFPARKLSMLKEAWRTPPKPVSARVTDISPRLDALVLSLLRIDVGSRPKSAAEVMDKLRPMLTEAPDEALTIADAYLTAPQLVGRTAQQLRVRKQLLRSARGRGGGFLVMGRPGTGRSRFVDVCVLEGKLLGATVARADSADAATGPFGMAQSIAEQLHNADPSSSLDAAHRVGETGILFSQAEPGSAPRLVVLQDAQHSAPKLQSALRAWILSLGRQRALALLVDDLHHADAPSLALFAAIALESPGHRITLIGATDEAVVEGSADALSVLNERLTSMLLPPLEQSETLALLRGVFGDIPNLTRLSEGIHSVGGGLPRETMALAQHLTDRGLIRYAEGRWTLPAVFDDAWLPATMEETLSAQVRALSSEARTAGLYLALSVYHRLSHAGLRDLMACTSADLDQILGEMRSAGFVTGAARGYMLCHGSAQRLLAAVATDTDRTAGHDALARLYESQDECVVVVAFHELQGTNPDVGLERVLEAARTPDDQLALTERGRVAVGTGVTAHTLDLAHREAQRQGRGARDLCALWNGLAAQSALGENAAHYHSVAPRWLELLKAVSGYDDACALDADLSPADRAVAAFSAAAARFEATPEAERILTPIEGIRQLAGYVVFGIAVGSRTADLDLINSLPGLLEPFCPLSPVVDAMHRNALATQMLQKGQKQDAAAQFFELAQMLAALDDTELKYLDKIRTAMVHAVNLCNAAFGKQALFEEATLQADPSHQVGLHYIKRVMAMQRGDRELAEGHLRDGELTALQNGGSGMFATLAEELWVCGAARDLPGLKAALERAMPLAEHSTRWYAETRIAEANYHLLRGEPDRALAIIAELKQRVPDEDTLAGLLFASAAVEVSGLTAIGELQSAVVLGRSMLQLARERRCFHFGRGLANALALAESAAGLFEEAKATAHQIVVEQEQLGVTGLLLGRSYATLARIAIRQDDQPEFERWAALAAEQFRPGESAVLGQLYEQLVEDARRSFARTESSGAESEASMASSMEDSLLTEVQSALSNVEDDGDQAQAALRLLCDHDPPRTGFLFLLTEAGLSLLASNEQGVDRQALQAFAEAQLEVQLDDDMCTVTSGDFNVAAAAAAAATVFEAANGESYLPVSLGADDNGAFQLVGIALVSNGGQGRRRLDAVATALARHLLTNPRIRPALAA